MSLLLIFGAGSPVAADNPVIVVPDVYQLDFSIDGAIRNGYIRFVQGFDISYNLNQRAILRCESIDPRPDTVNAYRPDTGEEVICALPDGTALFTGRLRAWRERPIDRPDVGTIIEIDAIDYSEVAEHTPIQATFGSDAMEIVSVSAGNPATVSTKLAHGFPNGATVTIENSAGSVPSVNGTYAINVTSGTTFTIPLSTSVAGVGGTVRHRYYLREVLTVLFSGAMAQAGVVLDPSMDLGPLLEKQIFDGSLDDALNQLGKATGYVRRFLPSKIFQMFEAGSRDAPFTLTKSNIIGEIGISKSRSGYANSIDLTYGSSVVATKHDAFYSDGVTKAFPLTYQFRMGSPGDGSGLAAAAYYQLPGTGVDVGPFWLQRYAPGASDVEWTFNESENELVQADLYPPRPAGTIIKVVYAVQFPQKITVEDPSASTPGNRFTKRVHHDNIYERTAAQQRAEVELALGMAQPRTLTLTTRASLAFPGTTITVTHADRNIGGDEWLIQAVNIREDEDGKLRYSYTLMEGNSAQPGWIEFFKGLSGGGSGGGVVSTAGGFTPGGGGGSTIGPGTVGRLAKWIGFNSIGDSIAYEAAGVLNVDGVVVATRLQSNALRGVAAGGNDLVIENAAGSAVARIPSGSLNVILNGSLTVNSVITTPSVPATNLTIGASGNIICAPGQKSVLPSVQYDIHMGSREKKWLTLWAAELWVETLVAQETIATIGGAIMVAPTTTLTVDVAPSDGIIRVKHNSLFVNDTIYLKTAGQMEAMRITGGPAASETGWVYSVLRNVDASGANQWYAGDAVVNTGIPAGDPSGRPQSSFIEIFSVRSVRSDQERGPTIAGFVRTGYGAFDTDPRWVLGNLRNFYGTGGLDLYGLALGNRAGNWMAVDDVRGIIMCQGDAVKIWIHPNGNAYFTGIITATSGSNVAMVDLSNVTTIDGGKITTNSIHANRIISGTITADKMAVGSLSAITADLGSVFAAGGAVAINTSGITLTQGSAAPNQVKWTNGSAIFGQSVFTFIDAPGSVILSGGGSSLSVGSGLVNPGTNGGMDLGANTVRFGSLYLTSNIFVSGLPTTTSGDQPVVYSTAFGQMYRRTDAASGTIPAGSTITVVGGLITGWT